VALALIALLLGMIALADPGLLGRWFGRSQSRSPPGDSKQGTGLTVAGTVKWFSNEKGYGFITPADGGADVFVHRSGIAGTGRRRTLIEGATVAYEVVQGDKGAQARNVVQIRS
jgi:cold shock protein